MHLTHQHQNHYKEQGFVVVPNLFDTATVTSSGVLYVITKAKIHNSSSQPKAHTSHI